MEKAAAVANWRTAASGLFTAQEQLALEYAEAMTLNTVDDALRDKLKTYWKDDAVVELTGLLAFQNLSSKFNSALDLPAQGFCKLKTPT